MTYLCKKAAEVLSDAVRCEFEGFANLAERYAREALFLEQASRVIPEPKQPDFWTSCLLGMIPRFSECERNVEKSSH